MKTRILIFLFSLFLTSCITIQQTQGENNEQKDGKELDTETPKKK